MITMEVTIKDEAIDEIITTALEGGSYSFQSWGIFDQKKVDEIIDEFRAGIEKGLWKRNNAFHYELIDAIMQGASVDVLDVEEYNEAKYIADMEGEKADFSNVTKIGSLNLESIKEGLKKAQENSIDAFNQHIPEYNNGDVCSADTLFQYMVLGRVDYC